MPRVQLQAIKETGISPVFLIEEPVLEQKEEDQPANKKGRTRHGNILTDNRSHESPMICVRLTAEKYGDVTISQYQHGPDGH